MKMLLLRPSQGTPKVPDRVQPITASGWTGLAVQYDPLTGPATSDVTFTINVPGVFRLDGYSSTSWTVQKNGTVVAAEGGGGSPYATIVVAAGDLIRYTSFANSSVIVWIE